MSELIFERSRGGRGTHAPMPPREAAAAIPEHLRRKERPLLPEV